MTPAPAQLEPADPFDLPDWLGVGEVTWYALTVLRGGPQVQGRLQGEQGYDLACDLLAVDEAYPRPVADDEARHTTHQAWRHGQVHVATCAERLTMLVPGTCFTADRVLDAVGRLAKAVGASPDHYAVHLRIGDDR